MEAVEQTAEEPKAQSGLPTDFEPDVLAFCCEH